MTTREKVLPGVATAWVVLAVVAASGQHWWAALSLLSAAAAALFTVRHLRRARLSGNTAGRTQ